MYKKKEPYSSRAIKTGEVAVGLKDKNQMTDEPGEQDSPAMQVPVKNFVLKPNKMKISKLVP